MHRYCGTPRTRRPPSLCIVACLYIQRYEKRELIKYNYRLGDLKVPMNPIYLNLLLNGWNTLLLVFP